jgi:hypothetical protein
MAITMGLRKEENHPVFMDGLQSTYVKFDLKYTIDKTKKVLTAEERTRITLILLASGIKTLI